MLNVLFIIGTRPEAIKLSPVIKELEKRPERFALRVCVTAQHREMLDQVLRLFQIVPDYDLSIMQPNQSLFEVTRRGLEGLEVVLKKERPDLVLVQGDTTTTFVGALAAYYLKIPVGHVEAGLRTYTKYRPFPEEINRRLTSQLVDFHFAPTETARKQLMSEGVSCRRIWVTGNTVIDALLAVVNQLSAPLQNHKWRQYFAQQFSLTLDNRPMILVTGHRRESFGDAFEGICDALKQIALSHREMDIVYPVHLNPNVQGCVRKLLGGIPNVFLLPPLEYAPFVYLMQHCYLVLTDSGGIQEEAPCLNKPVLVMRETTERPEAVATGAARLIGTDPTTIVSSVKNLIRKQQLYQRMAAAVNPYGDGKAAARIATALSEPPDRCRS